MLRNSMPAAALVLMGCATAFCQSAADVPEPPRTVPMYKVTVVERSLQAVNYQYRAGPTEIDFKGTVLLPNAKTRRVEIRVGYPPEDEIDDQDLAAATWTWDHGQAAGRNAETLPGAKRLFLPMRTGEGLVGVEVMGAGVQEQAEAAVLGAARDLGADLGVHGDVDPAERVDQVAEALEVDDRNLVDVDAEVVERHASDVVRISQLTVGTGVTLEHSVQRRGVGRAEHQAKDVDPAGTPLGPQAFGQNEVEGLGGTVGGQGDAPGQAGAGVERGGHRKGDGASPAARRNASPAFARRRSRAGGAILQEHSGAEGHTG